MQSKDEVSNSTDRKAVLFVVLASSFLIPFMSSSINIALPSIGQEFTMSAVLLSWVATAYLLSTAIFLVPLGRIADIYGRKQVYLYGMMIYTVFSMLCGISTSSVLLILFRFLQGIGSAMVFGTGLAILTSVFPLRERGKILGINVATVYLGLSLGPVLGGFLTQNLGWRSIFFVNVPLGIAVVIVILWKVRGEWAEAEGERFDLTGSIIYGISLPGIIYGLSLLPSILGAILVGIGIAGIIIFSVFEARIESPVLDVSLFRGNRVFTFSSAAALINYSATFAVGFLMSLYLQYIKGLDPQQAGMILIIQPFIQAVISPFAGKISDIVEPQRVASAGMALTSAALIMLISLNDGTNMLFILSTLSLLGLGLALFSSPNTNAIMSSVEKRFYGVASGMVGTMRLVGQMLSMGIAMLVFAVYIGSAQITPEYYTAFVESIKIIFAIMAVLCAIGVFASLARGRVRK